MKMFEFRVTLTFIPVTQSSPRIYFNSTFSLEVIAFPFLVPLIRILSSRGSKGFVRLFCQYANSGLS